MNALKCASVFYPYILFHENKKIIIMPHRWYNCWMLCMSLAYPDMGSKRKDLINLYDMISTILENLQARHITASRILESYSGRNDEWHSRTCVLWVITLLALTPIQEDIQRTDLNIQWHQKLFLLDLKLALLLGCV